MKHKILLSILTLSISFPVFAEYKIMLNSENIKIPEPTIPALELNHTFTNCSQTGRTGPSLNQCQNSYNNSDILREDFDFKVNDGIQIFTINKTGTYRIEANGARGGDGNGNYRGGRGVSLVGDFFLNKNDIIKILVGQQGETAFYSNDYYGGGGGASYVVTSDNQPLIVAAAGNGSNGNSSGVNASFSTGDGYGLTLSKDSTSESGKGGCGGGFFTDGNCSTVDTGDGAAFLNGSKGGYIPNGTAPANGGFGGGSGIDWNGGGAGGGYSGGAGTNREENTHTGTPAKSFNEGVNKNSSLNTATVHGEVIIKFIE